MSDGKAFLGFSTTRQRLPLIVRPKLDGHEDGACSFHRLWEHQQSNTTYSESQTNTGMKTPKGEKRSRRKKGRTDYYLILLPKTVVQKIERNHSLAFFHCFKQEESISAYTWSLQRPAQVRADMTQVKTRLKIFSSVSFIPSALRSPTSRKRKEKKTLRDEGESEQKREKRMRSEIRAETVLAVFRFTLKQML